MKKEIRIIGIDDGPFKFEQEKVIIIGVVMRAVGYIEGVLRREVEVDGDDATEIVSEMVNSSKHHSQLHAIMLDGIALGGFNVIDIKVLHRNTGIPVITITRDKPDLESMMAVLKKKFSDWKRKWDIIKDNELYKLETKHNPIYITSAGLNIQEAEEIIKLSTIRGVIPEPLRIAHLIASGVVRGESYGKA